MRNLDIRTKFVLFTSKTYKNGDHPIMFKATLGGKVKYHATGYTARPADWDEETHHIYKGAKGAKEANAELDELRDFAKHVIKTAKYQGEKLTLDEFMDKIKGEQSGQQKQLTVAEFFDKRIKQLKAVNDVGNASVYKGTKNALNKFAGDKLTFDKLTPSLLDELEIWLREGKNNPQGKPCNDGGVSYYMRTISAICTDAEDEGLIEAKDHPFKNAPKRKGYKVSKLKTKINPVALDEWEWELFKNFDYSTVEDEKTRKRLEYWHRFFLACYYGFGIRFVDAVLFTVDGLKEDFFTYTSKKTGKQHQHNMHPKFLEQIIWFRENYNCTHYAFGILNEKVHKTEQQKFDRIRKKMRQDNRALQEIGRLLGLKTHVTSKVARHSMATSLMRGDISIYDIQGTMMHSDASVTMRYLKHLGFDEKRDALLGALK